MQLNAEMHESNLEELKKLSDHIELQIKVSSSESKKLSKDLQDNQKKGFK